MLDLILSAQADFNSCLQLSSLPPKYRFHEDSVGWGETRSQDSFAPELILQDCQSC